MPRVAPSADTILINEALNIVTHDGAILAHMGCHVVMNHQFIQPKSGDVYKLAGVDWRHSMVGTTQINVTQKVGGVAPVPPAAPRPTANDLIVGTDMSLRTNLGALAFAKGAWAISDNGSGLLSTNSGTFVGNNGSAFVGNNGSAFVGNNGSAFVGNNGSAFVGNNGSAFVGNNGSAFVGNNGSAILANNTCRLITDNGGGLLSHTAANIMSNASGGIMSNAGGGLINNPAKVISDHGLGLRPGDVLTGAASALQKGYSLASVGGVKQTPVGIVRH